MCVCVCVCVCLFVRHIRRLAVGGDNPLTCKMALFSTCKISISFHPTSYDRIPSLVNTKWKSVLKQVFDAMTVSTLTNLELFTGSSGF